MDRDRPLGSNFGAAISLGAETTTVYRDAVIGAWLRTRPRPGRCRRCLRLSRLPRRPGLDSDSFAWPSAERAFRPRRHVVGDLQRRLRRPGGSHRRNESGAIGRNRRDLLRLGPRISVYQRSSSSRTLRGRHFGGRAGPLGDLDGDGCDDFFVGAIRYRRTEPSEGAAYLFHGSRGRRIRRSWFRVGARRVPVRRRRRPGGRRNGDGSPNCGSALPPETAAPAATSAASKSSWAADSAEPATISRRHDFFPVTKTTDRRL